MKNENTTDAGIAHAESQNDFKLQLAYEAGFASGKAAASEGK